MKKQLTPNWEFVSDTVMGGVSEGSVAEEIVGGCDATVLRGTVSLENNGGFIQDTVYSSANPLGWSAPDGYQSIESSKGTTIHDPNYLTVTSGYPSDSGLQLSDIQVVPNPYFARSYFNENEYVRRIRFTKLPSRCTIIVFTITGETVATFDHENETDSNEWWDLRTINNQEIGPGLYLYAVESERDKHIGKFVVVR